MDISRARLIQERWFSAIRWLLCEALFLQIRPESDVPRFVEARSGMVFAAFALYSLAVTIAVIARRKNWPAPLSYGTAAIDTLFATFIAASWSETMLSPGLIGIGATAIAVGVRRFPVFETFIYSLVIEFGMLGAHFAFYHQMITDPFDFLIVTTFAILPVLARAVTLAPDPEAADQTFARLYEGTGAALKSLPSEGESTSETLFPPAAAALAQYSESALAGVLIQTSDENVNLFTLANGQQSTAQLPSQAADQLATRLLAIREPTILSRSDNLITRGLPDQYPPRLDSLIVAPLKAVSNHGAVLFAANRKGRGYRVEDRILATLLGTETARLKLAHDYAAESSQALLAAADALLAAADAKRPGHRLQAEESARFAVAIARELNWGDQDLEDIGLAALLHDVGEIAIPDYLLEKTEQLTQEEFDMVKQHPRIAARIVDPLNRSKIVLGAIYAHHERWDGRGYPNELAGEDIPEAARILCLAHAMDAMLTPKPYRPPLTPPEALQEIILGSGTQFDPSTVQAFLAVLKREGENFLTRREATPAPQKDPGFGGSGIR